MRDHGVLSITDPRMTRFMITLEQGVDLVWHAFNDMVGGEIYVKKIPSMQITDIARVIAPEAEQEIVGIRPGEKLHEQMISAEDSYSTYEYAEHYKILPQINDWSMDKERIKNGVKVPDGFVYASNSNSLWMTDTELLGWLGANIGSVGES